MDDELKVRVVALTEQARPVWEDSRDTDALQEYLKGQGCHGAAAALVTMHLLACDLRDAQAAYFRAPCRAADVRFHNRYMDALADCVSKDTRM